MSKLRDAAQAVVDAFNTHSANKIGEKCLALESALANSCDECSTDLIDQCLRCGAPVCCPQCCKRNAEEDKK